jgi:transcriptional antiterminator NusG
MPDEVNANWYAVHTYAGQENKIKSTIEEAIEKTEWKEKIYDVMLPTEEKFEVRNGKKRKVQKKYFPSYLLVKMHCDEDSMHFVLSIPGVTNFLGSKNNPTPLTEEEVSRLVQKIEEKQQTSVDKYPYHVGDTVKISDGPFKTFSGVVDQVNPEKNKIRVMVRIFGRATPVELSFDQVTQES